MELKDTETQMPGGGLSGFSRTEDADLRMFLGFFVSAGLVNAMIAALVVCRLPEAQAPSLWALLGRGALYVLVGATAGVAGAYLYWRSSGNPFRPDSRISFQSFSLVCAAGWVWVPAAVLLSSQDSKATVVIGLLGGATLGAGLRKAIGPPEISESRFMLGEEKEMFAATLARIPRDSRGYVIAGCIYAGAYAQRDGAHLVAGLLCAFAAFLFAWNWKLPEPATEDRIRREAGWRLARTGALAILLTAWALMLGVAHRSAAGYAALAADNGDSGSVKAHNGKRGESTLGPGGFESVILWPFPPKKQIIAPVPAPRNYLGLEKSRPTVIRFDGAYWYFQPPDAEPGRTAHQAHGTPLSVNLQSSNSFPLVMEAHQRLIGPVRLSRCGEIDVTIQNRDNLRGEISLGVLLADSTLPKKATLYLGRKDIQTSLPGFFYFKPSPVFETLRFAVPATGAIRKFDEITIMLLPEVEHSMVGPRIAIEQFELQPR